MRSSRTNSGSSAGISRDTTADFARGEPTRGSAIQSNEIDVLSVMTECSAGGIDVLVEPEAVLRVVAPLQLDETVVVRAVPRRASAPSRRRRGSSRTPAAPYTARARRMTLAPSARSPRSLPRGRAIRRSTRGCSRAGGGGRPSPSAPTACHRAVEVLDDHATHRRRCRLEHVDHRADRRVREAVKNTGLPVVRAPTGNPGSSSVLMTGYGIGPIRSSRGGRTSRSGFRSDSPCCRSPQ